jgi:hypothetical protein
MATPEPAFYCFGTETGPSDTSGDIIARSHDDPHPFLGLALEDTCVWYFTISDRANIFYRGDQMMVSLDDITLVEWFPLREWSLWSPERSAWLLSYFKYKLPSLGKTQQYYVTLAQYYNQQPLKTTRMINFIEHAFSQTLPTRDGSVIARELVPMLDRGVTVLPISADGESAIVSAIAQRQGQQYAAMLARDESSAVGRLINKIYRAVSLGFVRRMLVGETETPT